MEIVDGVKAAVRRQPSDARLRHGVINASGIKTAKPRIDAQARHSGCSLCGSGNGGGL